MNTRRYIEDTCPYLFDLLDKEMPGDTELSAIPDWLNKRLGPLGLKPIQGSDDVIISVRKVENFLKHMDLDRKPPVDLVS